jgi:hypothetical protein
MQPRLLGKNFSARCGMRDVKRTCDAGLFLAVMEGRNGLLRQQVSDSSTNAPFGFVQDRYLDALAFDRRR